MRDDVGPDDLDGLLERPLVAVLATYRSSGDVLLSPVWHRWRDGGFDVVTGGDDVKARHLRGDPRASIVLFESDPPYRGIEVRGCAVLGHADADVVATSLSGTSATKTAGRTPTAAMTTPLSGSNPVACARGTSPMTSESRTRSENRTENPSRSPSGAGQGESGLVGGE
jgi:pyridoxamine 5'-phosphate oxidase-like protein